MNILPDAETLKNILRKSVVRIIFQKKDGTERTMKCTLRKDILPVFEEKPDDSKKNKKTNSSVLSVWDTEKNGYRSFRLDSLINYSILKEGYEL